MFPEIRVQVATVVVGLLTLTIAAEVVWAVSLSANHGKGKTANVVDESKYLPSLTQAPTTTVDDLIFAPPPSYAVLAPELEMTDITTPPAPANVEPVAGPAIPRPTTQRG